ncbi:hypothetical protein DXG01_008399 [Tephrocybe rancida]|nr:hypothetical protein DXG01_008399 [Tephrocybe rancida]
MTAESSVVPTADILRSRGHEIFTIESVASPYDSARNLPNLFKELSSHHTTMSPLMSSSSDAEAYVFKFRTPNGKAHRVHVRANDYKGLRDQLVAKLMTDPLFRSTSSSDPIVPSDPHDFQISYQDNDGNDIAITDNNDIQHAIVASKMEGTDRVMLTIQGGPWWPTNGASNSAEVVKVALPITSETVTEPAAVLPEVPTAVTVHAPRHLQQVPIGNGPFDIEDDGIIEDPHDENEDECPIWRPEDIHSDDDEGEGGEEDEEGLEDGYGYEDDEEGDGGDDNEEEYDEDEDDVGYGAL